MGGIDKFQSDLAEYNNAFEQLWDEHLEKIIKNACRVGFSEGFALELGKNKTSQESEEPVNSSATPVQQLKAEIAKQLGNFTKYRDHYRCIPDTYDKLWQLSDI